MFATEYCFRQLARAKSFQLVGELVDHVDSRERVVALTFDDGPDPASTDEILATLSGHSVRATFFLVGRDIDRYPHAARKIIAAGHQIANHSYTHRRMVLHTRSFIKSEIERTDEALRRVGWTGPIAFRPPYGRKLLVLPWYLRRHHRPTIMWNVDAAEEAKIPSRPDVVAVQILKDVRPGAIILLHAMGPERAGSRRAIGPVIEGLSARGYRFVTIEELLALRRGS